MGEQTNYEYLIGKLVQCQFLIGLVTQLKLDASNALVAEVLWCNSDLKDKRGTYIVSLVEDWHERYLKYRGKND